MTKLIENPVETPASTPVAERPGPVTDGWQREYKLRSWVWELFGLTLEELCIGHAPEGWR